ncbi:hypothetical protein HDU78_004306 [Chytriomyces hyalinus]|nr:hypothetical protein HDU78_004306 [Chytriomyces hyalinus]
MSTAAQISTLHELRNGLFALRLDVLGKLDQAMMIIESLLAGSNCNVQPGKLDVAVAPAGGENLNDEFERVPNLAKLGQLDSEMTLLDDTSADSVSSRSLSYILTCLSDTLFIQGEDEESTATDPPIAKFSYAHYTDLEVVSTVETRLVRYAAPPQQRTELKGTSVSSGSQCKSRRKRVYRPPAKGLSARLTQEQINFISLQRLKK